MPNLDWNEITDRALERLYRKEGFETELQRLEFPFVAYLLLIGLGAQEITKP